MKQKFILEKEEMDILKQGGSINLNFAGGKIELSAEVNKYRAGSYRDANSPTNKQRILAVLRDSREPMLPAQIAPLVGTKKENIYAHLYQLSKKKLVIGSDAGWRIVHETTAKLPAALTQKNGHKVTANGR